MISEATVKAHVSRLLTKLDVTNRCRSRSSCTTHDRDPTGSGVARYSRLIWSRAVVQRPPWSQIW